MENSIVPANIEKFHTLFDFLPVFELRSEQWPEYDPVVYQEIVWDREYFLNIALTVSITLEVANMAYYKLSGTFTLIKLGLGV